MLLRYRLIAWTVFALIWVFPGPALASSFQHVSVLDGDTIQIDGRVIHIYGIDAPELGQHCLRGKILTNCGLTAAFELQKFIDMQLTKVVCVPRKEFPRGNVQVCTVGHANLAKIMLRNGSVRAIPKSDPDYLEAERYARVANLGIWHVKMVPPWDWRAGKRLPEEKAAGTERPCPVKGLITKNKKRIFYVVTDAEYWHHHVDPARGDRYFCSLDAAWKAGWRHVHEGNDKPLIK